MRSPVPSRTGTRASFTLSCQDRVRRNDANNQTGKRRWFACLADVHAMAGLAAQPTERGDSLEMIIVTAERLHETPPTEATAQTEKLLDVPGSFGDPLQSVFSLPGVLPTSEIGGAPAVRGSAPEDNRFLTDFLPTGYLFHAFGFSIFNENLIRDFGIKNAGFGARYGGATGAVFDVHLREPRAQPWTRTLEASFLRVGAMIEGALTDSQTLYVSARESLLHLLLQVRKDSIEKEEDIRFHRYPRARDVQGKYSWKINHAHRLSVLVVGAYDATGLNVGDTADVALLDPASSGDATFEREFSSEALNGQFDDGTQRLRAGLGHLRIAQDVRYGALGEFSHSDSTLWTAKLHYERSLNAAHTLTLGAEHQRARFDYDMGIRYRNCTRFSPECEIDRGEMTQARDSAQMNVSAAFLEARWRLTPGFAVTLGMRAERLDYSGAAYVEPRLAAHWRLGRAWELRALWGRYHEEPRVKEILPQFGNPRLGPIEGAHYVLGATHRIDDTWSWSLETYYKDLDELIVDVPSEQRYINAASGRAYGSSS